jgi:hypothetical protein
MPRQNIIFSILAPLVLMAIIAVIVVGIGETLLEVHETANEAYHVGAYASAEENKYWGEIAALYPVFVALGIATLFLIGGATTTETRSTRPGYAVRHRSSRPNFALRDQSLALIRLSRECSLARTCATMLSVPRTR